MMWLDSVEISIRHRFECNVLRFEWSFSIRIKILAIMVGTLLLAFGFLWIGDRHLTAARYALEQEGPSEFVLKLRYGFTHSKCQGDFITVIFWQRGPKIPEREGYVCGGVFSPAHIEILPDAQQEIEELLD